MIISTLIADDEPHARRYLKGLLEKDGAVGVVYECKNGNEVLKFLKHHEPDIIFLDINMPGLTGIDVAAKLKSTSSLIIFSTAYDQYALKAFELKAFDYLLKPFDEHRFNDVLQSAKRNIEVRKQADFSTKFTDLYREYNQTLTPHLSEFVIKNKGITKTIKINDILYIEASSIYVILHLLKNKVLYRVSLNLLEQQLPSNFFRIHRTFIINQDCIETYKYLNNSTYMITLTNKDVIISSRKYKDAIAKKTSNL
ncbi:LytTR family DNA-binding domain-containing protein [uncultured Psychroserpens sp.]|uniref:LytR/AlgR family response regulator transcription factor n=1 Tax=uncultured Psychroserpens sp. TaxID=255436 RepID=UPI002638EC1E|nr:response regulator transcription factor [uncultured Psychroserpens sp.]